MNEWGVFQTIIIIVGFLATIVTMAIKLTNVIQKNTDAINNLSSKLDDLTVDNNEDHDRFYKDINQLKTEQAVMKEHHEADINTLKLKMKIKNEN